jgi:hypothetical protein
MRNNSNHPQNIDNKKPPISISLHPEKSHMVKTFVRRNISSMKEISYFLENYVCAGMIYKGCHRRKENFISGGWIGLDIDKGLTLVDAIDTLKDMYIACVVGTSRSHQKEKRTEGGKVEPPCDRFRIFIEMQGSTECLHTYEYNVREWIKVFSSDKSCIDGARLFRPIKVVFVQEEYPQAWLPLPPHLRPEARAKVFAKTLVKHKTRKTIPSWVLRAQENGVPPGGRHLMCYRIGATLAALGYEENEISEFILSGPLIDIGVENVRRQVEWGAKRAREDALALCAENETSKKGS